MTKKKLTRQRLRQIIREEEAKLRNEARGNNIDRIRKHLNKIIDLWENVPADMKDLPDAREFEAKIYDADHFLSGLQ